MYIMYGEHFFQKLWFVSRYKENLLLKLLPLNKANFERHTQPDDSTRSRISVQGVKSLGGQFACLCRGFEFYEEKKCYYFWKWKYFYTFCLQKEQNSKNLLLPPPICRNKPAITPTWFNSLDTNSKPQPKNCVNTDFSSIWFKSHQFIALFIKLTHFNTIFNNKTIIDFKC